MPDKSYVTLEQNVCCVCAKTFDTGSLLLDRRLRPTFDRFTVTGWGMCPEHQKLYDEGYIALVGCDPEKSNLVGSLISGQTAKQEEAYRTGSIAHIRVSAWEKAFDSPLPTRDGSTLPMVFVEEAVIEMLQARAG